MIKALAMTYSCMRMHTTIGAGAFHFRVREGIGWYHTAMAAREAGGAALRAPAPRWDLGCEQRLGRWARRVSRRAKPLGVI